MLAASDINVPATTHKYNQNIIIYDGLNVSLTVCDLFQVCSCHVLVRTETSRQDTGCHYTFVAVVSRNLTYFPFPHNWLHMDPHHTPFHHEN